MIQQTDDTTVGQASEPLQDNWSSIATDNESDSNEDMPINRRHRRHRRHRHSNTPILEEEDDELDDDDYDEDGDQNMYQAPEDDTTSESKIGDVLPLFKHCYQPSCGDCGKLFPEYRGVVRHVNNAQCPGKLRLWDCLECGETFLPPGHRNSHAAMHTSHTIVDTVSRVIFDLGSAFGSCTRPSIAIPAIVDVPGAGSF